MIVKEAPFRRLMDALAGCLTEATGFDGLSIGRIDLAPGVLQRAALQALVAIDPVRGMNAAVFIEGEHMGVSDPVTGKTTWWPPKVTREEQLRSTGRTPDRGNAGMPYDV